MEGIWIIEEMYHSGKQIYPNTIVAGVQVIIEVDPAGYENAEKITFAVTDSSAILPGFESDVLKTTFSVLKDSIVFKQKGDSVYDPRANEFGRKIFLDKFEIIRFPREEILGLKSRSTTIRLINQDYLFQRSFDEIFHR
ncbi:hypothetical protein WIW50_04950 [Flavobacteriaceae bacterium 3-367]|uniref:hypothetical protein n=1 Tax=Eudoraea algarum TaxID=3417568 RepID=UPI00328089B1